MAENEKMVRLYGTAWCYSSRKAKKILEENQVPYEYFDIDYDQEARSYVESVNHGNRSVPTILFPDGSLLVEPSTDELCKKLGIA